MGEMGQSRGLWRAYETPVNGEVELLRYYRGMKCSLRKDNLVEEIHRCCLCPQEITTTSREKAVEKLRGSCEKIKT